MVGTTIEHLQLHACPGKIFNDLQQTAHSRLLPLCTKMFRFIYDLFTLYSMFPKIELIFCVPSPITDFPI